MVELKKNICSFPLQFKGQPYPAFVDDVRNSFEKENISDKGVLHENPNTINNLFTMYKLLRK